MEITEFCTSGFTAHACAVRSLHVWYLWCMPEMDLTSGQGERSSGNEIGAYARAYADIWACGNIKSFASHKF